MRSAALVHSLSFANNVAILRLPLHHQPASALATASTIPADEERGPDEHAPLLGRGPREGDSPATSRHGVSARIARRLHLSHFLSTWNSHAFEFGAMLYLATICSGTLLPMSVYALTCGLSAIVFAPAVGRYIDTGGRLRVVRVSISRLHSPPAVLSCRSVSPKRSGGSS